MEAKVKFYRLHFLEKLASYVTKVVGSSPAIVIAFTIVILWLLAGPFLNFSDQWLWFISITATIITFLMVFVIQKSQNKDSLAIQLKLNELIAAHELASNRLVDVENMTEEELRIIQKYYAKLSAFTKKEDNYQQSHSIDEIEVEHDIKNEMEKDLLAADLSRNYLT